MAVWKREFYASGEQVIALDGEAESFDPSRSQAEAEGVKDQNWSWKANFPAL